MNTAHQPGSEPVQIPEQIPNPAVRPPAPEPKPGPRTPVELPEKVPANRAFKSSLHTQSYPNDWIADPKSAACQRTLVPSHRLSPYCKAGPPSGDGWTRAWRDC